MVVAVVFLFILLPILLPILPIDLLHLLHLFIHFYFLFLLFVRSIRSIVTRHRSHSQNLPAVVGKGIWSTEYGVASWVMWKGEIRGFCRMTAVPYQTPGANRMDQTRREGCGSADNLALSLVILVCGRL